MHAMPQVFHLRKTFDGCDGCEPSSRIYEKLEYSVSHAKTIDTHRPKLGHIQIHGWTYLHIWLFLTGGEELAIIYPENPIVHQCGLFMGLIHFPLLSFMLI